MAARDATRARVIDDAPTIVFALKKILPSAGFIAFDARDAESGISLARTEIPDPIFLDITCPVPTHLPRRGPCARMRPPRLSPPIMISGNEQATEPFFGSRTGADDFMKKPFSGTRCSHASNDCSTRTGSAADLGP